MIRMGATTSRRMVDGPPIRLDPSPALLGDAPVESTEVLIKEARRRQRRRWAFSALAILVAVGLVTALMGDSPPPTKTGHGPTIASPGDVAAFLARAEKGFAGQLLLRYSVQYGTGPKSVRGSVVVAQLSKTHWAYFSTPSVPDIHGTGTTSSVFSNPIGAQPGRYFCQRTAASSPWNCSNFSTAGMGGNAELLGPYPPTALILGLQNAIVEYSGKATGALVSPQPAYLVVREVDSRKTSCLAFGKPANPVALVCLDAANLVASYDIPSAVTGGGYSKAQLRSESTNVSNTLLALPAIPTR
jgi:hypothetical protein